MLNDVSMYTVFCDEAKLTLEKLLARVFLKESFVNDWTRQVIDHQLQDRLDLLLAVSGVMCEGRVL